jgi:hypothetical protein
MTAVSDAAAQAAIGAAVRELKLPTIRDQAARLAEIAVRERHTHLAYLAEVLSAELDDCSGRRRARLIAEARFPRLKRLADFNGDAVPASSPGSHPAPTWTTANRSCCSATAGSLDLLLLDELGYVQATPAARSCSSRSSPSGKKEPRSRSGRICRSANAEQFSLTPGWPPRSWTGSPSTLTSSRPAPSPTGCTPARPPPAAQNPLNRPPRPADAKIHDDQWGQTT